MYRTCTLGRDFRKTCNRNSVHSRLAFSATCRSSRKSRVGPKVSATPRSSLPGAPNRSTWWASAPFMHCLHASSRASSVSRDRYRLFIVAVSWSVPRARDKVTLGKLRKDQHFIFLRDISRAIELRDRLPNGCEDASLIAKCFLSLWPDLDCQAPHTLFDRQDRLLSGTKRVVTQGR